MSLAIYPFQPTPSMSMVLCGGRAPACWRREVARGTSRLDDLWRSCAWVEALARVRPSLREGPLWGECLAALTAEGAERAGAEPAVHRQRRAVSTNPAESLMRETRAATAAEPRLRRVAAIRPDERAGSPQATQLSDTGRAHQRIPELSRLPQQASDTLLVRLVGSKETPVGANPSDRPLAPTTEGEHRSRPGAARVKSKRQPPSLPAEHVGRLESVHVGEGRQQVDRAPLRESHEPGGYRAWRGDLSRRVKHALYQRAISSATDAEQGEAVLAQQWSASIAGPAASHELLMQMAGLTQQEAAAPRRATRPTPLGSIRRELPLAPEENHEHHVPESASEALVPPDRTLQATKDTLGTMTRATASRVEVEDELPWPARIAPPAVTPRPLPLVPPEVVGMPAPASGDDLSALAANIKRILEEEARRHGIDV